MKPIFVAGASGFVGHSLVDALVAADLEVRAGSRAARPRSRGVTWLPFDLDDPETVQAALTGCDAAYFLVHGLARGRQYGAWEARTAVRFRDAAARAGVQRIVYLGGMAPSGRPSPHLASRLAVGELLRGGEVPTVEVRASMLIGPGSASWIVARDLAFRLPVMLVPRWVMNRTQPLAVEDAVAALVAALKPDVEAPSVIDLPGRKLIGKIKTPHPLAGITITADGKTVVVVDDEQPALFLIDTAKGEVVRTIPLANNPKPAQIARFRPDYKVLAVSSVAGDTVTLFNADLSEQTAIPVGKGAMDMAFRGNDLFVGCQYDGTVHVIDIPSRRVRHSFACGTGVESLGFF